LTKVRRTIAGGGVLISGAIPFDMCLAIRSKLGSLPDA
jgi:hypothetical protein